MTTASHWECQLMFRFWFNIESLKVLVWYPYIYDLHILNIAYIPHISLPTLIVDLPFFIIASPSTRHLVLFSPQPTLTGQSY
jgi:hypothetical protein